MKLSVILTVLLLSGCSGMADLGSRLGGLGVISTSQSTFDNSSIIEVSPNWLYDPEGSWGNRIKLGGKWISKYPDVVALLLSYGSDVNSPDETYIGIQGIEINLNGEILRFNAPGFTKFTDSGYNTVSKNIYTESKNYIPIPYDVAQRMVNSPDTRLRIHTSGGYEDSRFSIERMSGGSATAITSFRKFLAEVNTRRGG